MAFPQLRVLTSSITASPIRHTTRRLSSSTAAYHCMYVVCDLLDNISHSVVSLKSYFDYTSSSRVGTGVFLRPGLLVTSAHVVGSVVGEHCEIARTAAITEVGKVLLTRPLAVNLGGDVAVLLAVGDSDRDSLPTPASLASETDREGLGLTVLTRHERCNGTGTSELSAGAEDTRLRMEWVHPRTRTEWVHPVGDEFGWARYGTVHMDDVKIVPGSPWFGLHRQVVGIASRAAGDEPVDSSGGFVVPPPRIRAALDYAATRGPDDPLVMDRWIKATTVSRDYDTPIIDNEGLVYVRNGFFSTAIRRPS